MLTRRKCMTLPCTLLTGATVFGCASPLSGIPRFPWEQPFEFGGIAFDFNSVRTALLIANLGNQPTPASDRFIIVKVTMQNKTSSPIGPPLHPLFQLLDSSNAMYKAHPQNTVRLNQQATGMILYFQNLNPNIIVEQEIVFDAPLKPYTLLVTMPTGRGLSVNGKVTPLASHFIVDISSQIG